MKFVPAAVLLLLAGGVDAFAPPRPTAARHRQLRYVRHEDGMGWPQHQHQHQQPNGNVAATAVDAERPPLQRRPPPHPPTNGPEYEAKVERRFSRYVRRERLRNFEWQRRELEEAHRQHMARLDGRTVPRPRMVGGPIPIVNFRTNSDFPGAELPASRWERVADHPVPFEEAEYRPCTRGVRHVLVPREDGGVANGKGRGGDEGVVFNGFNYRVEEVEDVLVQQTGPSSAPGENAYWLQDKLQGAIYGQVRYGTVLRRLDSPVQVRIPTESSSSTATLDEKQQWATVEYVATNEHVAVKEMNWEHIRTEGQLLAEDPIKEVAAMQHLQRWAEGEEERVRRRRVLEEIGVGGMLPEEEDVTTHAERAKREGEMHHIMMPMDLLSDDENLYSITPFCTGGRLLDVVEGKSRFSEPEARYWMRQILKGLSCLKRAGCVHRDMSPENLMVHEGNVYIIDLGMALRIPYRENGERSLILPQTPCGKWYYLSPEVLLSEQPFDGPAVDLWAAGVILYIMLVGSPPWEEPKLTDENFKLMSTGYLAQILSERRAGLSADAMDLLQRMFWMDPADRLSLEQVCNHPWITHGDVLPFNDNSGIAAWP